MQIVGKSFLGMVLLGALLSCGKSDSNSNPTTDVFAEIQKAPPSEIADLISVFGYAPSTQAGALIAFYRGNRYFSGVVQKGDAQHYRISGSVGFYDEQSNKIKFSGKKTTCQSLAQKAKGKTQGIGSSSGKAIAINIGSTTTVLNRVDVTKSSVPQGGFVIEWGCFNETSGAFTPEAWSEIK